MKRTLLCATFFYACTGLCLLGQTLNIAPDHILTDETTTIRAGTCHQRWKIFHWSILGRPFSG